jgi:hypothetical protein
MEVEMQTTVHTSIGELVSLFYDEFMEIYGDSELAAVAAAAVINDLISAPIAPEPALDEAA